MSLHHDRSSAQPKRTTPGHAHRRLVRIRTRAQRRSSAAHLALETRLERDRARRELELGAASLVFGRRGLGEREVERDAARDDRGAAEDVGYAEQRLGAALG